MVKREGALRHHFNPSYSQCADIYLSALHRPIAEINLILIVHPMPTAGKLKVEGQVHASPLTDPDASSILHLVKWHPAILSYHETPLVRLNNILFP